MLNAAIGTLATVAAVTATFTPTLFGSLSKDSLESLGFTPAVLGCSALTFGFMTIASIQQICINRAIENASRNVHEDVMLKRIIGEEVHPGSALQGISVISSTNGVSRN